MSRALALSLAVVLVPALAALAQEASTRALVYAGDANFLPYEYLDAEGRPNGFNVEVIRLLAEVTGRPIEIRLGLWADKMADLDAGRVDLMSLAHSDERAERYDYLAKLWTLNQAFLFDTGRAEYPAGVHDLSGEVVAVEERGMVHEMLEMLPAAQRPALLLVTDPRAAARALFAGDATALGGNSLSMRHMAAGEGIPDLVEVPVRSFGYYLAAPKGAGERLADIAAAVERITLTDRFHRIVERTLLPAPNVPGWRDHLRHLAILVTGFGGAVVLVLVWNNSLRRQVERRTTALAAALSDGRRLQVQIEAARAEAEDQTRHVTVANEQLVLEQSQREQVIAELRAKNDEMERFTYAVSHDLKSPLITIIGFLGIIEEELTKGNTDRARERLGRIAAAAQAMHRLLDELLELSRAGRAVSTPQSIAFWKITEEALVLVGGPGESEGIEIQLSAELPEVIGDRSRIVQALQNLISNATKFTANEPQPHIVIGARVSAGETIFFVKDNGPGIEPRFHDRVFRLFDRLDTAVEGSGIGLALVKRIIEVHGGRIWIESQGGGSGTTFCFTLPVRDSGPPSERSPAPA